ncbi:MAG: trypsin-like peptidase domain-containing protein [Roseiflexaceae bacterium]
MAETATDSSVLTALSTQMADAVARIEASLVMVNGRPRQPATGILISPELVLTADHVLEREEELTVVTGDGRELPAQFAGRDPATDLAVLRVPGLDGQAATAAAQEARVGQIVLAVGRPSSHGPMASIGIVSAVGGPLRTARGGVLERFIQTDATPYPGFSGGPLIDTQGAVLGLLTTGLVGGVPLAVPTAAAWQIAETITKQGYIKRGYLGISSQPVELPEAQRAGRTQERGLLVVRVEPNSPAEASGLLMGDILVGLAGQTIGDTDDLQALLTGEHVGKALPAEVIRGGVVQTLQVTIGQRK